MAEKPQKHVASAERTLAKFDSDVVDIEHEHQALLAMFRHARLALAMELAESKGGYVTRDQASTLKELAAGIERLTGMEIKLDATREKRAQKMSIDEYLLAARRLVMSQDHLRRKVWLRETYEQHCRQDRGGGPEPQVPEGLKE